MLNYFWNKVVCLLRRIFKEGVYCLKKVFLVNKVIWNGVLLKCDYFIYVFVEKIFSYWFKIFVICCLVCLF